MRTQQLHTIIFLSHYEAVKGAVAPVQRGRTTVCSVTPIWFPFSFFYPHNIDFDLFQCPMHFNLKKWTWAASSAILRVAVISQRSLLHPASFCCSNFPNGLILNYEFPKIYYTYITHSQAGGITQQGYFFLYCRETRETNQIKQTNKLTCSSSTNGLLKAKSEIPEINVFVAMGV